jgi:hypothetical protein
VKKIATQLRALKGCPANSSVRGCTARLAVAVLSFFANKGKANVLLNEPQQVGLSVAVRGDGTVLKQSTRHLVSHASRAIFCCIPPMSDICRHPGGVESPECQDLKLGIPDRYEAAEQVTVASAQRHLCNCFQTWTSVWIFRGLGGRF